MAPPAEGPLRSVLEADNILHMATPAESLTSVLEADNILHMVTSAEGPGSVLEADNILHMAISRGSRVSFRGWPQFPRGSPIKGFPEVSDRGCNSHATESLIFLFFKNVILHLQRDNQGSIFGLVTLRNSLFSNSDEIKLPVLYDSKKGQYFVKIEWED
jgi:hypothetical protein